MGTLDEGRSAAGDELDGAGPFPVAEESAAGREVRVRLEPKLGASSMEIDCGSS
jgi:hypothetical protein